MRISKKTYFPRLYVAILIVVVAILACGVGYYVYRQMPSNWRLYESSGGYYTLKAPNGWVVSEPEIYSEEGMDNEGDWLSISHGAEGRYSTRYFDEATVAPADLRGGRYSIDGERKSSFRTHSGLTVQEYYHERKCSSSPGLAEGACLRGEQYTYDISTGTKHVVVSASEDSRVIKKIVKTVEIQ